jgi:competence protein ComEA
MIRTTRLLIPSVALIALAFATSAGAAPLSKHNQDAALSSAESRLPAGPIDINTATLTVLRSLPGIGTANARKIVAGRPYASVDDLKARNVLPIRTYDKIRDRIDAKGQRGTATGNHPDKSGPAPANSEQR